MGTFDMGKNIRTWAMSSPAGPRVTYVNATASSIPSAWIPDEDLNLNTQSGLYEFIARRSLVNCICGQNCHNGRLWDHIYNLEGEAKRQHIAIACLLRA